jgi:indolepyruvate ferredoxin oxidoreductase
VAFVLEVAAREEVVAPGRREVTHAVIKNLYKLMAYKDEYEVARLHLKPAFRAGTRGLFAAPRRVAWHLHPPLLRALGLRRKLRLGPWFRHALGALRALRRLRGTPFDPFGYAAVRREERRLVPWYRELVSVPLRAGGPDAHATALELARLPESIRGYEDIKLRSIAKVRGQAFTLVSRDSTRDSTSHST